MNKYFHINWVILVASVTLIIPIFGSSVFENKANATDVFVKQRVVQFDANTFLGIQGYYTHGQNLKNQKLQEEEEKLKLLKEQNEILKQMVNALINKQNVPAGSIPLGPQANPMEPTNPEIPEPSSLESKVLSIYNSKCAKCHGEGRADGGLMLVKDGKVLKNQDDKVEASSRMLVHHRVNGINLNNGETRMPKGSPALSDEEVEILRLWAVDKSIEILNRR